MTPLDVLRDFVDYARTHLPGCPVSGCLACKERMRQLAAAEQAIADLERRTT